MLAHLRERRWAASLLFINFLPRREDAMHRECAGFRKATVDVMKDSSKLGHELKAVGPKVADAFSGALDSVAIPAQFRGDWLNNPMTLRIAGRAGARALGLARQGQDPLDGSRLHYAMPE